MQTASFELTINGACCCLEMKFLFVLLIGTFVEIGATECGQLTFASNDVKEGETATLILNSTLQTTKRIWQTWRKSEHLTIYNSNTLETVCKCKEVTHENVYKLHIYHVDAYDAGFYFVECHLPNGTTRWSTTSPALRITSNGSQETDCGRLIARKNNVEEGNDIELSFKGSSVRDSTIWEKEDIEQRTYHSVKAGGIYEIKSCDDGITILKVLGNTASYKESGNLRVTCGQSFSNVVHVHIIPPQNPTFRDAKDIHDCRNCIPAEISKQVTVTCYAEAGSQPRNCSLLVGDLLVNSTVLGRLERKNVTYDFTPMTRGIVTLFRCVVRNLVSLEQLEETAKVYIYVKPSKIEVTELSVKENKRNQILCITYNGRPPLQPMIAINNIVHNMSVLETVPTGDTYTVRAGFSTTFNRQDNNASVSCCINFLEGQECGEKMRLNVAFPPIEIIIKETYKNITEDGNANITLTCKVGASNPPSNIVWTEGFSIPVTTRESVYEDVMTFNLTREDNGREIHCTAVNSEFSDHNITAIYEANITYAPLINIPGPENRTVYVGDYVDAMCYVESNPESKIVWFNGTERLLEIAGNRLPLVFLASSSMKGLHTFTCIASNNIGGIQRKRLTVFIEDRPINEGGSFLDRHWTFGIVGVVIGFVVCFIVTMIIVMIRKRRQEQTPGLTTRSDNVQNTESDAVGNIGENRVAYDSLLPKSEMNTETGGQEYMQMIVSHPGGDEEEREHVYDN